MAAALALTAIAPTASVALPALAGVGFSWSILVAAVISTLQSAEVAMTGRVMATLSVVLLGGLAAGGPIASAFIAVAGPRATLGLGAVVAAAVLVSLKMHAGDQDSGPREGLRRA
jgi:hypothetical protein